MNFIIDSSVALSWCFIDEATEVTETAYRLALSNQVFVPPLWHTEVANILGVAIRRKRIDADGLRVAIETLRLLEVITLEPKHPWDVSAQLSVMQSSGLTAYDATYLHLAQQQSMPLATFDGALVRAAAAVNVSLVHL